MNKQLLFTAIVLLSLSTAIHSRETRNDDREDVGIDHEPSVPTTGSSGSGWWSGFKSRVKSVLSRWREDIKHLWDDVLAKAEDMRGWTSEVYESLKVKLKEWVETRTELPDDQKNEIDDFISKLKVPKTTTEQPLAGERKIDP